MARHPSKSKPRTKKRSLNDVYTYTADKKKSREARNEHQYLDDDERLGYGAGGSGDEGDDDGQARLVGEEGLRSDEDDEEIESDDAFGSSDSEDETDEDEEDEDGEYLDILDVLDGRVDVPQDDEDEELEEDEEDEGMSVDEEEEEVSSKLTSLITSLPTKRPNSPTVDEPTTTKKRRLLSEKTETGPENPFHASSSSNKLSLDDLLAATPSLSSSSTALLSSTSNKKGVKKAQLLSAPLPLRQQEKIDRSAAYEETKTQVSDNWNETMKHIRDAEFLQFPLQQDPKAAKQGKSEMELAARFKPSNELESGIASLLKKAGLGSDADMLNTEEDKLKKQLDKNVLSKDELLQRQAHLRQMRALTLRAELKARRANKIKSKVYRKLKRKQKAKLDGNDEDDEQNGEETQGPDLDRIRARAGLKVKAKRSRPGQHDASSSDEDEDDAGKDIEREERLQRLIRGQDGAANSDDDEDEEDEDEDGEEWDLAKAREAFSSLSESQPTPMISGGKKGGVMQMKFMQDAFKRQERAVEEDIDEFIKGLGEDAGKVAEDENGVLMSTTGNGGRMSFRPGTSSSATTTTKTKSKTTATQYAGGNDSQDSADEVDLQIVTTEEQERAPSESTSLTLSSSHFVSNPNLSSDNPWLARTSPQDGKRAKKGNREVMSKEVAMKGKGGEKVALYRAEKKSGNGDGAGDAEEQEEPEELEMGDTLGSRSRPMPREEDEKNVATSSDDDDDSQDEATHQERLLSSKKSSNGKKNKNIRSAEEQRELVALAFGGTAAEQNFHEIKRREIEEDAPKEIDTSLPGWGSWGGSGLSKREKAANTKRLEKLKSKGKLVKKVDGVKEEERKDKGKDWLVVSEKKDKKASKYQVPDLPYPYTSRRQYENAMRGAVGKEWNTTLGFQRATLPRVSVKPGTVVEPLTLAGR